MAGISFSSTDGTSNVPMSDEVRAWRAEIQQAQKRVKDYRKDASRVVKLFEAEKKEDYQFNILYSNTETLLPALYNSTPRPDVQPRYKVTDQLPNVASQVCKRTLEFLLDTEQAHYSKFDTAITSAVLEGLVPGQGCTRFKYDYEEDAVKDVQAEADDKPGTTPPATVKYEYICAEEVPWDRVLFGYCRKWKDLPWVAFEHFMNQEELKQNFGAELAALIPTPVTGGEQTDENGEKTGAKDAEGEKLAHVMEIWDKAHKEIVFIAEGYGEVVKKVPDPLKLKQFWPMPQPISFFRRISGQVPQTLYAFYEEQAKELNTCTRRINMIMRALKVRGFYDATLDGLDELMKSEDNTLLPAENVSAMLQGQTLEKAIWLFPLEKLVLVLQQLYVQREQVKQVIYEVTGISDIIRGSNAASETATASNIKSQWGTIRLKKAQKEVQRYVKDSLRIMAELAFKHLSAETIAKMTGMQLPTEQQQQQAQALLTQLQQQAAATAQLGQPPQPPQGADQLQQILSTPSWEAVMGILSDDIQRDYRIDIESNSTIDEDATQDKQDVAEFMNAMGQFLSGTVPLIEQGVMPFEVMKATLLAITQRFRFGREVEDQLRNMTPPNPPSPDAGEQAKAQTAQAQAQADQARIQAESDAHTKEIQMKMALMDKEMSIKQQELALKQQELEMRGRELQQKTQASMLDHAMDMEAAAADRRAQQEATEQKMQVQKQGFLQKMFSLRQAKKADKGDD